jgi:hypothetical protein
MVGDRNEFGVEPSFAVTLASAPLRRSPALSGRVSIRVYVPPTKPAHVSRDARNWPSYCLNWECYRRQMGNGQGNARSIAPKRASCLRS